MNRLRSGLPALALALATASGLSLAAIADEGDAAILDPTPDIKVNGSDGPLTVSPLEPVQITVALDPGLHLGQPADVYGIGELVVAGMSVYFSVVYPDRVVPGERPYLQIPLLPVPRTEVYQGRLPPGHWFLHFGVDANADGIVDWDWFDTVEVRVGPVE